MSLNYGATAQAIGSRISHLFNSTPPVTYAYPTKRELAKIPNRAWVPQSLIDFCHIFNGISVSWEPLPAQQSVAPHARGRIGFQRLQDIYGSWEGVVYFEGQLSVEDPDLRHFHLVDMFSDEEGVGLYHDERQDPQLYVCGFSDYAPEPLGVDFDGYLQLLRLSLGHQHWPHLLAELYQHFSSQPTQPFQEVKDPNAQIFVRDMTALVPDFSLEAFVALYDQVRLSQ